MTKVYPIGKFKFKRLLDDPEGDIGIERMSHNYGNRGTKLLCGLRKGSRYLPRSHPYRVTISIIEGTGVFYLDGEKLPYKPGTIFEVDLYVPHAFLIVDEESDTVFVKDAPNFHAVH